MLNAYNITSQTLGTNDDVIFSQNSVLIGSCTQHDAGSSTITLTRPGVYAVTFSGTATASTSSETDPIVVQLYDGTSAVLGASASALSAGTANDVSLSFTTFIKVGKSCPVVDNSASLVVTNTGAAATFINANIAVTKIL